MQDQRLERMTQLYKPKAVEVEHDDSIRKRLSERFEVVDMLTEACVLSTARSLVISGPPGLGKSFAVERMVKNWDETNADHTIIKGYARPTGLVKTLWRFRHAGQLIVFDDCDSIFNDETSLSILKTVCDTTEERVVSWLSERPLVCDDMPGDEMYVPSRFVFNGAIIFITNYDFDETIDRGHRFSEHFQAMISRSHYIDLAMKTERDYLIRINMVIEEGMLDKLTKSQQEDVKRFVNSNFSSLREKSLRLVLKVADLRKTNDQWEKVASITCLRQKKS